MSIASSMGEIYAQNPSMTRRELFRAGMHVGRDMMGTDSNTLILAFAGGSVSMLLLDYAYDLPFLQDVQQLHRVLILCTLAVRGQARHEF